MKLYFAKPHTNEFSHMKEFVGEKEDRLLNPAWVQKKNRMVLLKEDVSNIDESNKYMIPMNALIKEPGEPVDKKIWVADFLKKEWELKDDFRGQKYYEKDGTEKEIKEVGELVPEGCLTEEGETPYHDSHDGSIWIENTDKKDLDSNNLIKNELSELDRLSIRDIRELLVEQFPDNPVIQKLVGYESEAKTKRLNLK